MISSALRKSESCEGAIHWVVAHRAELKKSFHLVLSVSTKANP